MSRKPGKPSTFKVSLSAELARFVRDRVESGLYASASEVVREALRSLAHLGQKPADVPPAVSAREQEAAIDRAAVRRGFRVLERVRARTTLGSVTVRDLIDEGRR